MEGHTPFAVLDGNKGEHSIYFKYFYVAHDYAFVPKLEIYHDYAVLGGTPSMIIILRRGVFPIYCNVTWVESGLSGL